MYGYIGLYTKCLGVLFNQTTFFVLLWQTACSSVFGRCISINIKKQIGNDFRIVFVQNKLFAYMYPWSSIISGSLGASVNLLVLLNIIKTAYTVYSSSWYGLTWTCLSMYVAKYALIMTVNEFSFQYLCVAHIHKILHNESRENIKGSILDNLRHPIMLISSVIRPGWPLAGHR